MINPYSYMFYKNKCFVVFFIIVLSIFRLDIFMIQCTTFNCYWNIKEHMLSISVKKILAYAVHIFTASGAILGIFAIRAINQHNWLTAFLLMGITICIDAVDGTIARRINIKNCTPHIDGALLDNIIDFFTYSLIPSYFVLVSPIFTPPWQFICSSLIILASAYQFTQADAKTPDHFFKGFPSYWNITVFYLFYWQTLPLTNTLIIILLFILSFIPIKYIYPSRMEYLSSNPLYRKLMSIATMVWGITTFMLILTYPTKNTFLDLISISYIALYFCISLYRTIVPVTSHNNNDQNKSPL